MHFFGYLVANILDINIVLVVTEYFSGPKIGSNLSVQALYSTSESNITEQSYNILMAWKDNLFFCFSPHETFLNPLEVESIAVRNAIKLDANHTLVVYKQNEEHIERRIVSGPIVFVPGPQEWLVCSDCCIRNVLVICYVLIIVLKS